MLSYFAVYNTRLGQLSACAHSWDEMARDLQALNDDIHNTLLRNVHGSGWSGKDAEAGISFIERTSKEFEDAVKQAKSIHKILAESHDAIKRAQESLHKIAEEDAPELGLSISSTGSIEDWFPERVLKSGEVEAIEKAIEKALVGATEADENAAYALMRLSPDGGFGELKQDSLIEADAAESEQRFNRAEKFIYEEMIRNIHSDDVKEIRELILSPGKTDEHGMGPLLKWASLVAPGAKWDHKPIIEEEFGLDAVNEFQFKIPGSPDSVSYDIYSNIHYGYVGRAAGINTEVLIEGANIPVVAGSNDRGDDITMRIGAELYEKYGPNLTQAQLHEGIEQAIHEMEARRADQVEPWKSEIYR